MALRDNLVSDSEVWSICRFILSSGVFYFCVWPIFIEAVIPVVNVYSVLQSVQLPWRVAMKNRENW